MVAALGLLLWFAFIGINLAYASSWDIRAGWILIIGISALFTYLGIEFKRRERR